MKPMELKSGRSGRGTDVFATEARESLSSVLREAVASNARLAAARKNGAPKRSLALLLIGLRQAAGLSASALARAMGRDRGFVSRIEAPVGPMPDIETIARYAAACGLEMRSSFEFRNVYGQVVANVDGSKSADFGILVDAGTAKDGELSPHSGGLIPKL